jgi:hypothetical protein
VSAGLPEFGIDWTDRQQRTVQRRQKHQPCVAFNGLPKLRMTEREALRALASRWPHFKVYRCPRCSQWHGAKQRREGVMGIRSRM